MQTRSSAVAKTPRDASCLYSFYTRLYSSYTRMVWLPDGEKNTNIMFIRLDMIHEREKIAVFMYRSPHFCFPWRRPWGNHAKCCMDGKEFDAYKLPRRMYPSIFNSFPVIRTASAKNRHFHVPQPTFLFPLETPLRLSRNMLHGWKDNSMLAKSLAASTYLSSIVSELYDA